MNVNSDPIFAQYADMDFEDAQPVAVVGALTALRAAAVPLKKWDSAAHLHTEADMQAYLNACLEEAGDDAAFIAKALGTIARARGMTQLAQQTGLGRESLYKTLSGEGNPSFATVLKVIHALGLQFQVKHA